MSQSAERRFAGLLGSSLSQLAQDRFQGSVAVDGAGAGSTKFLEFSQALLVAQFQSHFCIHCSSIPLPVSVYFPTAVVTNDHKHSGSKRDEIQSTWFKIFPLNNFSATQERMLQFRVVKSRFLGEGNVIAHAVKLARRSGPPVQDRESLHPVNGCAVLGEHLWGMGWSVSEDARRHGLSI